MRLVIVVVVSGALLAAGCSIGGATGDAELLVSAAASLTDAFADIEAAFEEVNPGVDVLLNLGGSSTLREQILEGAPAEVFASANMSNMVQIVDAGHTATQPETFARNLLQIAVPAGNPGGIIALEDFADEHLLIGFCAVGVPCGDFGREALTRAGVSPSIDTDEHDVRALLTKIEAGELDAGITYVTDVISTNGAVEGIDIPEDVNVIAEYPIVVLAGATHSETARDFVAFVLSAAGQAILIDHGFISP